MKKKHIVYLIILLTIFVAVLSYRMYMSGEPSTYDKRLILTRNSLEINRSLIKTFKELPPNIAAASDIGVSVAFKLPESKTPIVT